LCPTEPVASRPEQVIQSKLVDLNGQPAAGVELRVTGFGQARDLGNSTERFTLPW